MCSVYSISPSSTSLALEYSVFSCFCRSVWGSLWQWRLLFAKNPKEQNLSFKHIFIMWSDP